MSSLALTIPGSNPQRRIDAYMRLQTAGKPQHDPRVGVLVATNPLPPRLMLPAPAPNPKTIEYGHKALAQVSRPVFDEISLAVCRLADNLVRFALGEINPSEWTRAVTDCMRDGNRIARGRPGLDVEDTPDTAFASVPAFMSAGYSTVSSRDRSWYLHDLLLAFFDLDLPCKAGSINHGDYRYTVNMLYEKPGLTMERRDPESKLRYIQANQVAFNRDEAHWVKAALDRQWDERRALLDKRINIKSTDEIPDVLNRYAAVQRAVDQRTNTIVGKAIQKANEATRAALGKDDPATTLPLFAPIKAVSNG